MDFIVFEIQFFRLEAARRAYLNKKNGTDNAIVMVFAGMQKRTPMYALQLILVVMITNLEIK